MQRILVVDDEPLVAELIRRTLASVYDVTLAASGADALERIARGEPYGAIVTDLHMPGVDGVALRDGVQRLAPQLAPRMLFLTGGALDAAGRAFLAEPAVRSLHKPFRPAELLTAIAEMLGQP